MFSLYTGNFFTNLHSYANFLITSSFQGFWQFCFAATQLLQSVCPDTEMAVCAPVMSTMASVLTYDVVDTPMGPFTLGASDFAIHSAYFGKPSSVPAAGSDDDHQRHPVLALVKYPFSSLCLWFFQAPYGMQLPLSVKLQSSSWVVYIVGRLKRAFDSGRWLLFLCSSLKAVCAHLCAC